MKSIIIYDWMLRDPKLNGYKLLIFATVYHFSSLGGVCFMSIKAWLDLLHCSRSQFFKAREDLIYGRYLDEGTDDNNRKFLVCCVIEQEPAVINNVLANDIGTPMLSWDELMRELTKDETVESENETVESENETVESENETVESENETLPY